MAGAVAPVSALKSLREALLDEIAKDEEADNGRFFGRTRDGQIRIGHRRGRNQRGNAPSLVIWLYWLTLARLHRKQRLPWITVPWIERSSWQPWADRLFRFPR